MTKKRQTFLRTIPISGARNALPPVKKFISYFIGNLPWWQIFLIFAGFVGVTALILSLFFSFGDHTKYRYASELHPVNSEEFLKAISSVSNSQVNSGGGIGVLNNGDEFLPSLLNDIQNASSTINFTAYIWEKGEMSDRIFGALIQRARAGVQVRVLLDGFGGHAAPDDQINELVAAGGQVEKFRSASLGKFTRVHKRDHRRAIVIDGRIGYTGGMAVADHWLGNARNTKEWRDMMFRVTGLMAQSLQSNFAELWAGTKGEILEGDRFYPNVPSDTSMESRYVSLGSSPASDTEPLPKFFWLSVASAQKSIVINSSYFVPDKHIREALMERARAGVDVRVLVPNNNTDAKPIRLAGHYYYEDLLSAGVKIYEYQPTMIHSKFMVIDNLWSIIGSANMDIRSVQLNEENVMGILNPNFAAELERVFNKNLEQSKQFTLEEWNKRSVFARMSEALFVNFVKQY